VTDRLPTDYTNSAIIKRQLRREFWREFAITFAELGLGILALMGLIWLGLQ